MQSTESLHRLLQYLCVSPYSQYGTCGQQCSQESAVCVSRMCPQTTVVRTVRMCPQTRRTSTATLKLQLTEFLCVKKRGIFREKHVHITRMWSRLQLSVCVPRLAMHPLIPSDCSTQFLQCVANVHVAPDCSIRAEGSLLKKRRRSDCSIRTVKKEAS